MTVDLILTPNHLRMGAYRFPCSVGRSGLTTDKVEGDGATPIGEHRIVDMLYRADRIARPCDWATPIGPDDLWSDDPADIAYNSQVKAPYHHSHEALRRADPMYDLILVTDWNYLNAHAGKGSAIFIHQWRRPRYPTAGCIAVSRANLWRIATTIPFGCRLIIGPNNPAHRK